MRAHLELNDLRRLNVEFQIQKIKPALKKTDRKKIASLSI